MLVELASKASMETDVRRTFEPNGTGVGWSRHEAPGAGAVGYWEGAVEREYVALARHENILGSYHRRFLDAP